jgi:hypothetical protein
MAQQHRVHTSQATSGEPRHSAFAGSGEGIAMEGRA